MNKKMIGRMLGYLLLLEAVFLIPALGISVYYAERNAVYGLMLSMLVLLALGSVLVLATRKATRSMYAKEGFLIVALAWCVMSVLGSFPFFFSGEIPHFVDAVFETVSGFTTTGSSVLTDVESMSRGLLYWRSFTQWLGGMGMLVFLLLIVKNNKGKGNSLHLIRAESPGPSISKIVPKTRQMAAILYGIYFVLTASLFVLLLFGGMSPFESVCHAFATAGTGGFGVRNDSLASYSPYIQNVISVYMALFGVNFSVYYLLLIKQVKSVLKNEELRLYLGIMFGAIVLICINVAAMFETGEALVRHVTFSVISVMTTTGFATTDFNLWPEFSHTILVILMILGASASSTGGGLKSIRVLILFKNLKNVVHKMLHPHSVKRIKVDGKTVEEPLIQGVNTYTVIYFALIFLSVLLISVDNFSMETNLTAVLSSFNNIGPGLGDVGPTGNFSAFSSFSKVILCFDMLFGRLEIFPMLILLNPDTWKKKI